MSHKAPLVLLPTMLAPLAMLTLQTVLTELTLVNNAEGGLWFKTEPLAHGGRLGEDWKAGTMFQQVLGQDGVRSSNRRISGSIS